MQGISEKNIFGSEILEKHIFKFPSHDEGKLSIPKGSGNKKGVP
jgi:hypothetical protein